VCETDRDNALPRHIGEEQHARAVATMRRPVAPAWCQGSVELEECCRLDERANLGNPARAYEQRGHSEHKAIEGRQIRCALPGSIADQKLMFEQKRLCGDGACTARAEQLRDGDQQVDG
jgi:hypothetical protein